MTTGIRWLSVGPGSGLGDASEAYLSGLRAAGIPVSWTPLAWPSPIWGTPYGPVPASRSNGATHRDCVDYDLVPTMAEEADDWWRPVAGERWAKARIEHAAIVMRQVFDHPAQAREAGRTLRST